LGETINVMTLGGLALAVGILVDDATVNQSRTSTGISSRARKSSPPFWMARSRSWCRRPSRYCASASLFVPMFGLGGVAGYLFPAAR